jgi:hypothetical protein
VKSSYLDSLAASACKIFVITYPAVYLATNSSYVRGFLIPRLVARSKYVWYKRGRSEYGTPYLLDGCSNLVFVILHTTYNLYINLLCTNFFISCIFFLFLTVRSTSPPISFLHRDSLLTENWWLYLGTCREYSIGVQEELSTFRCPNFGITMHERDWVLRLCIHHKF